MVLNSLPCVLVSLCLVFFSSSPCKARIYTNHWAVRIAGGPEQADHIANKYGYRNLGQIGDLKDYYHFFHSRTIKRSTLFSRGTHSFISMEPKHCNDNIHNCQSDMNIVGAWKRGYTGKDVVVTILDDGIERNHPDLIQNYDNEASYDVNGNDMDPMPRYDASNENKHGTRCAGEVAASANNSHCTVGIAYNAKIGGVRMLDGDVTDMVEAKSLSLHPQHIDIYSASWGPDDDGKTVDGPASLARQAFENGIRLGRKGRGSIFVWASGNGGRSRDHCSCDGYTNSIYTISISSTAESGRKPWYLEECASTLTTTYSSGENYDRKIITTDLRQRCTDSHTGTSASAPMAAGIIALALEANPFLTWRDVQHIIVKTSRAGHLSAPDWKTNAAGYNVSHLYGFGLMDAEAMVKEAERWKQVPPQHICVENADKQIRTIRPEHVVRSVYKATGCTDNANHHVIYLEHVVVRITITHPRRGDLSINLTSPSGTKSQLLANRLFDHSMEGFKNWEFMTTHCWGEKAAGDWILEIYDSPSQLRSQKAPGKLKEWSLILYGTSVHPYSFRSDKPRSLAEPQPDDEYSEEYVGSCHPECGENGCEGPGPQQCITCLHYFLKFKNNTRSHVAVLSQTPPCVGNAASIAGNARLRTSALDAKPVSGTGMEACNECAPGYYFEEWRCVSSCNVGYYLAEQTTDNGDVQKSCQKCDPTCYACAGPGERNCSICVSGYNLENGVCVVSTICKDGEYLNKHDTCELCSSSCSKCTGPESTDCISCPITRLFDNGTCVLSCGSGKFERDGQCHHCHHTCLECTDTGPDKCSCCSKDRFGVERYLFEGECRESCPEGYSHSSKGTCDPCPLNCTVCTSTGHCLHCTPFYYPKDGTCSKLKCGLVNPEHCMACLPDYYRLKSSCHKICPERMFQDKLSMVCARCDDHCETCDASECYLCDEGYFLSDGTCVETCKEGFYGDMKQECEPCHHTCRSCGGPDHNDCDSCEDDMFLDKGQSDCEQCDSSCWTCSGNGKEQCDSCQDACDEYHFLHEDECLDDCPKGYFTDVAQKKCTSCNTACAECDGPDEDDCTSCGFGYVHNNGQCLFWSCPPETYLDGKECRDCDKSCLTCSGPHPSSCLTCRDNMRKDVNGHCEFFRDCSVHTFTDKDGHCKPCHKSCLQCSGAGKNQCISCNPKHFLLNQTCVSTCPGGYYVDEDKQECVQCHVNYECIVMLSYNLFNNDPVTFVHPGLFVSTVIFVLVGLWLAIFLFLQFRQKITSKPIMESNGYSKISDGPFTSATLSDSMQAEYCDKEAGQENDEEEDEDIVYMGRDGIVYRKFKYSLLEGEEEVEEVELEYDDMYTLT
ncbi:pro convertase subtilisin kexin type 5 isoform X1 [Labeo rohita]|uniref:Pro convertase subtilisin kexin type 5 isoform X1 n=1 Tax=Labeo rohita TaxID=84645 RepID=A0A498MGI9_LABRO|nr:pro convertase subtilisin kexin type 5 isoform X1 [Labeo rohita]